MARKRSTNPLKGLLRSHPEMQEIEIEMRRPTKRAAAKPYLVISLDCLHTTLMQEEGVIASEDVPRLLKAIALRVHTAGNFEVTAMRQWETFCNALSDEEEDDET